MSFLCGVTKKTATVSMTPRSLSQRCQFYFRVWLRRLNDTAEFDFHHWHQSGSQIVYFFFRNKCKNVFKIYLRSIQLFLNMNHGTKWTEIKKEEIFLKINAFFHSEVSMTYWVFFRKGPDWLKKEVENPREFCVPVPLTRVNDLIIHYISCC